MPRLPERPLLLPLVVHPPCPSSPPSQPRSVPLLPLSLRLLSAATAVADSTPLQLTRFLAPPPPPRIGSLPGR